MAELGQIGAMNSLIGSNMHTMEKLKGEESDSQSEDYESNNDNDSLH